MPLSDRDRAILDFERSWWMEPGPKEPAIRAQLSISPTRYYDLLRALLGSADAAAHDPLLLKRLQRSSTRRRRARHEGPGASPATRRPAR